MKTLITIILSLILFLLPYASAEVINYSYEVVNTYPHDKNAFTQGLLYKNGFLYEGTGLKGESSLRKVDLKTGQIQKINNLADQYFGEGITIFQDKIYQLTWKSKTGFVYDMNFNRIKKFNYSTEGWGLTNNYKHLIMSDGTNKLYYINPDSFKIEKILKVKMNHKPLENINELEYIKGKIYANIWQKNIIVKINPDTGQVTGIINLEGIINPENYEHKLNVLNGIAYNKENDKLLITGKLWPHIFEIKTIPSN